MHRSLELFISGVKQGIYNVPCDHHATEFYCSKLCFFSVYCYVVVAATKYVTTFLFTFLFD